MSASVDPNARFNLSKASVLVIDSSQHAVDMLVQIVKGFGAAQVHRCMSIEEADQVVKGRAVDLIIIDPKLRDGDGYEFLTKLRHSGNEPVCHVPVILISGHSTSADVGRARDTGANFFVTKPLSPSVLLQRILWVARDKRPFVEVGQYIGPDRRFKFEGPPPGLDGRRDSDATDPLGDASAPNLSQNEIDTLIKPQRVMI